MANTAQRPPEIKALARALSRDGTLTGDAFIERAAEYVRLNVETEFRFGLGKGARGAVIDQSGTAFDQAELMVEILREGGQSASYRLGTITLTADQFGKWSGLATGVNEANQTFSVNAKAACQLLANGGIPALVNGVSACGGLSGNLSTVVLGHLWVFANGKSYDPGFKLHILRAGIDVAAALGCGTMAAPTCGTGITTSATSGAQQGTAGGAPWIQTVNQAGVESYIQARAQSLQATINGIGPTAPVSTILGGRQVDQLQSPVAGAALPYETSVQATWTDLIPDQYRAKFRVRLQGLDATLYADEIAGKRLRLATYAPNESWSRTTKLFLDGSIIATGNSNTNTSNQVDQVQIDVDHPFPNGLGWDYASSVSVSRDTRNNSACWVYEAGSSTHTTCSKPYFAVSTLVLDVGNGGQNRESHYSKLLNARNVGDYINTNMTGLGYYYNGYNDQKHAETLAARHAGQSELAFEILGATTDVSVGNLHTIGALFHQAEHGDGQLYFNLRHALTVAAPDADQTKESAAFLTAEAISSALEGSVLQQSQDAFESSASTSMFKLANDQNQRFYEANASNLSAVLADVSDYSTARKNVLTQYAAAGYTIILPSRGLVGTVDLPGSGTGEVYIATVGQYIRGASGAAHIINEEYKGGGAAAVVDPVRSSTERATTNAPSLKDKSYWGVDLASGSLNLSPPPDLALGGGASRLEFRRTLAGNKSAELSCSWVWLTTNPYAAETYYECTPAGGASGSVVGGGWQHSLDRTARWSGSGSEGLGATSALRSSQATAAIFSIYDAHRIDGFTRRIAATFGAYSLINGFLRNSVALSEGSEFVRLPTGAYDPPPGARGAQLTIAGSPGSPFVMVGGATVRRSYAGTQISVTGEDGAVSVYQPGEGFGYPSGFPNGNGGPYTADNLPVYALTSATAADGSRTNYAYEILHDTNTGKSSKIVNAVSNSFGHALNLQYEDLADGQLYRAISGSKRISTIADSNGRSVGITCTDATFSGPYPGLYQCAIDVTDPANGITRYSSGSGDGTLAGSQYPDRVISDWFTPADSQNAFLRFNYDPVLHVASYTDATQQVTKVFATNMGSDRFRLGELRSPLGEVSSSRFDENGSLVRQIDPLGRTTSSVYDSARRVLRTVYPEGNGVEYRYDLRGNTIRECQIAKGRVAWASLTVLQAQQEYCNSGLGDLDTSTYYEGGPTLTAMQCPNSKTCNKPSYMVDPRGYRTSYNWSPQHGQLLSETSGLNSAGSCAIGSVCPRVDYGYSLFTGTDGASMHLLTSKTEMVDATNSTVTTYEYDAANHFALKSATVTANGQSLKTCFRFDAVGNLISKTDPLGVTTACP